MPTIKDYESVPPPDNAVLRSAEVSEIITNNAGFLVRNGIGIFFLILLIVLGLCSIIPYPDAVKTSAKLMVMHAPKTIVCNNTGKLIKLNVKETDTVQQGDLLGLMESIAKYEDVKNLSLGLMRIKQNVASISNNIADNFIGVNLNNLGELQPNYQLFTQAFTQYKSYLNDGYFIKKKEALQNDFVTIDQLNTNLQIQKGLQQKDLELVIANYKVNSTLHAEKIMNDLEYRNEQSKLINKQLSLPQLNTALIQNNVQKIEKEKQIAELDNTISQQKIIFEQAVNSFMQNIEEWKKKYTIIAPIAGQINFANIIEENQQLAAGQNICFVNPNNTNYYALINIRQGGLGKIKLSQSVQLKFVSYAVEDFGYLKGTISFISQIPTDSGYIAKVILENGLTTNYNKKLTYKEGLIAEGEIILEKMTLLEKFYKSIIKKVRTE